MITLHGFGEKFGIKDPSPLVLKVDVYMRMSAIKFNNNTDANNLQKAPKGKLPFVVDGEVTIADSQFIIEYLRENHVDLDAELSKSQKALAYLVTKSLDENLYFCLVYSRWMCDDTWAIIKTAFFGGLPVILRNLIPKLVRKKIKRNLLGQGLTKHNHEEILHICKNSFIALNDLLGNKKYFFGDAPSSLDASVYAMLTSFILTDIENQFNSMAKGFPNLVEYCNRIEKRYFAR